MADTASILTLMRHAADRLAEEEPKVRTAYRQWVALADRIVSTPERETAIRGLASTVAATTLAQTVLRMVADFMTDAEGADHD